MSDSKENNNELNTAGEPEVAYGSSADSLRANVVDAIQSIQDVNILESILSFIKKKVDWQDEIPNEETLAAMREAENGECEILDVEHFKEYVASL